MSTTLKSRRFVTLVAAAAVATAVALILALSGSSSDGGGFGAELADAADSTAAVSSGVARAVVAAGGRTQESLVRFDGPNLELEAAGQAVRVVDDQGFTRAADGTWTEVAESAATSADDVTKADILDTKIIDVVRAAEGAVQDGNVYRARVGSGQNVSIDNALLGLGEGSQLAEGSIIEVEVAGELIRRVSVASGDVVRSVTYSELNQPQEITAPETE